MIARRDVLRRLGVACGVAFGSMGMPGTARACLYGKWWVKCPNGHVDMVDDGTCSHKCERCGLQVFRGNQVTVVCPNGHANTIDTGACGRACTSYKCETCGSDCRVG